MTVFKILEILKRSKKNEAGKNITNASPDDRRPLEAWFRVRARARASPNLSDFVLGPSGILQRLVSKQVRRALEPLRSLERIRLSMHVANLSESGDRWLLSESDAQYLTGGVEIRPRMPRTLDFINVL